MSKPVLLAVSEVGGYPNFSPIYEQLGFTVIAENSMRKVLKLLKKQTPDVIVAEFNYQSDFRDRTSSLESMMSVVQRHPEIKVVIFYDKEHEAQLGRLQARFKIDAALSFPFKEEQLANAVTMK